MNGTGQKTWLCNLFMCNKLKKKKDSEKEKENEMN